MNRRTRRQALASILTDLARKEKLSVLAPPAFDQPKTRKAVELLEKMGMAGKKVLFVTPASETVFAKSVRNIPRVKVIRQEFLNPHDLMSHEQVVLFETVIDPVVAWLASPRKASKEVSA
jgi:large subunit ribosomal protein L4